MDINDSIVYLKKAEPKNYHKSVSCPIVKQNKTDYGLVKYGDLPPKLTCCPFCASIRMFG